MQYDLINSPVARERFRKHAAHEQSGYVVIPETLKQFAAHIDGDGTSELEVTWAGGFETLRFLTPEDLSQAYRSAMGDPLIREYEVL